MGRIRIVEVKGTPYQMGYQHGQAYAEAIRLFAKERVQLSGSPTWTERSLSREEVLALGDTCVEEHRVYAPELVQELQGMADATGLSLSELIILNGFTDFVDVVYNVSGKTPQSGTKQAAHNCTAFIVPDSATEDGHGFCGQTWDMHATATPHVILLRTCPVNGLASLMFTVTGCVGMIGMNEAGIAVCINNLLGSDGQVGVTWPFVIRKILSQTNIDDALSCITSAKLAGAHNYLLFDKTGQGYNIEAMSTQYHFETLKANSIAHTNHCFYPSTQAVEDKLPPGSQARSSARLARTEELLALPSVKLETLIDLTRDELICVTSKSPRDTETCGAVIMRPATGDFWAVWGLPTENEYERFTI